MGTMLLIISKLSDLKDIVACFGCEILLLFGFFLNFVLIFLKNKINVVKTSNFITTVLLIFNILLLSVVYTLGFANFDNYSLSFWSDYFEPNSRIFSTKILINLFMLFFIITNLKSLKKYRFRVPVLNSIILLLTLSGCLITQVGHYIVAYLLIEATSILIYKFASNMRIKKYSLYSSDFITLSLIGTLIFTVFCFIGLEADKPAQTSIINTCLSIAVLIKVGLFPIYNYLIIKQAHSNIPFAILLYCFLPWMGVIAFDKMSNVIMPSDEIYQIPMLIFVMFSLVTFAFYASKHKNIIKFFANFSYFVNGLCILSIVYFQGNYKNICLSTLYAFSILSVYSLITVVKNNLNLKKVYIANLKGLFLNNRRIAFLLSAILIVITGLIPSGIMNGILKVLKDIYIYDKTGFLTVCAIVVLMILILSNSLKYVQEIYAFDKENIIPQFTKRTTPNIVVPLVVLIFLFVAMFL